MIIFKNMARTSAAARVASLKSKDEIVKGKRVGGSINGFSGSYFLFYRIVKSLENRQYVFKT